MHTLNTHTDIQTLGQSAAGTPLPTPLMYITTHIKMHTHTHKVQVLTLPHQLSLEILLQGLMTTTERTKEQSLYKKKD